MKMKRYIVVKHNTMRNQKFYLMIKDDCWTLHKPYAYKFLTRWAAQAFVDKKKQSTPKAFASIIEYKVEEIV